MTDIPTLRGRLVMTRKASNNQRGRVSAAYLTVVDPCPRCAGRHQFQGALNGALAYLPCGTVRVVTDTPPGR